MIQINELRIGNLIRVNGILSKIEIINNELDEVYFFGEDFYHSDFCCNIEPMPITKEWLFKLGFELINNNFYRSRNCELCLHWTVNKNKMLPEYYGKRLVTGYDFKYVHQLQNLYFALTGDELTVA